MNFFFWNQVLTYAQQSKEQATIEQEKLHKRIQEFRTQAELDSLRASSNIEPSAAVDGNRAFGLASYKNIDAIMQSSANGKVRELVDEVYFHSYSSKFLFCMIAPFHNMNFLAICNVRMCLLFFTSESLLLFVLLEFEFY